MPWSIRPPTSSAVPLAPAGGAADAVIGLVHPDMHQFVRQRVRPDRALAVAQRGVQPHGEAVLEGAAVGHGVRQQEDAETVAGCPAPERRVGSWHLLEQRSHLRGGIAHPRVGEPGQLQASDPRRVRRIGSHREGIAAQCVRTHRHQPVAMPFPRRGHAPVARQGELDFNGRDRPAVIDQEERIADEEERAVEFRRHFFLAGAPGNRVVVGDQFIADAAGRGLLHFPGAIADEGDGHRLALAIERL